MPVFFMPVEYELSIDCVAITTHIGNVLCVESETLFIVLHRL